MNTICCIIGLVIIIISVFLATKNRYNTKKCTTFLTLGVLFSTFFMILPTQWIKDGKEVTLPNLYSIVSSLFYSFKALGGKQDLAQLESIVLSGYLKYAYILISYTLFIIAPIIASSLILSFFGDTIEKLRYLIKISPKCCIFSELNNNSLALAKSIKKERGYEIIVFCNVQKDQNSLVEKAKKTGAILLSKPCYEIKVNWRFGRFEYYLLSESEHDNIKCAETLILNEKKRKNSSKKMVIVNAFAQNSTSIKLLESLSPNSDKFQIRFVNEIALFCDRLIYDHPIFELPDGRKDISVMIVGCGSWGEQMLKTVIRNGQIDGYSLKIRVYDKSAIFIEKAFYHSCPELKKLGCNLEFIETDILTDDFFEKANESIDATYVCIATGSDESNLSVSDDLFRYFRRKNGFSYTPPIFTRVRKDEITKNLVKNNNSFLSNRNIKIFGTADSFFSEGTLFNTKLEKLSFAAHLCYNDVLDQDENNTEYIKAVNSFYNSDYNRRSSRAAAVHFATKMLMCCGKVNSNDVFAKDELQKYKQNIIKEDMLKKMAENEHIRWNYFMATEGYQSGTIEDVKKYFSQTKSHKDESLSKTHPCIAPIDRLKNFEKEYNKWAKKNKDFIEYDVKIVKRLPDIINLAKRLYDEEKK